MCRSEPKLRKQAYNRENRTAIRWLRITAVLFAALIMTVSYVMPSFAEGETPQNTGNALAAVSSYGSWTRSSCAWNYYDGAGQLAASVSPNTKNKWVYAGGKKFRFGKKKEPLGPGFHMIKDKLYYMGPDGSVTYGTFEVSGEVITTTASGNITGLPYCKYKYRNKRFVFIDISDQRLQFYRKGSLILDCPVVTGRVSRGWKTPTGSFKVRSKTRNTTLGGSGYSSRVSYWMAFIGNEYGMHDASWRSAKDFADPKTYLNNGSHGCVNMRPADAARLYKKISRGTAVIIQK